MSNKKGMTLIEVIVALAVFAILMVMTTGVFSSAIMISNGARDVNDNSHNAQQDVNNNNPSLTETPADELVFDFNGKPVKDQIETHTYDSNGLQFDDFKAK